LIKFFFNLNDVLILHLYETYPETQVVSSKNKSDIFLSGKWKQACILAKIENILDFYWSVNS